MGYCWGVEVELHYCVPIKFHENACLWHTLKRLAEYEPGYAERAPDAAVTRLAKLMQKRTSQSIIVLRDSPEFCEDDIEKDVENPTPLEERFHYNPELKTTRYDTREFNLEYNYPELLGEAFEFAASKLLGEGHGITLVFHHGYGYNGVEPPAKERALFMTTGGLMSYGGMNFDPRGGIHGVPWGVQAMKVPAVPTGAAQKMERLVKAFGLEAEGDPGWRVITAADYS